jgi:hypothetical protein
MEKYYERKARRGGAKRICRTPGCQTELSRYNESKVCGKCEANEEKKAKADLLAMVT